MTGAVPREPPARRVDAHLHVWDLSVSRYAWLRPDMGPLYRDFPPQVAGTELERAGFDGAVLVQAEDSERDTAFMLDVADEHPWVLGVVGWVQLDEPRRAERQLDRWQRTRSFCGVRQLVHDDPRPVLTFPSALQTLRLLASRGLPFDVPDAWPRHLGQTVVIARDVPDLTVVVDHLGKPPELGTDDFRAWRRSLAAVAALPNTVAKFSGLQRPSSPLLAARVRALWEIALELFGPQRLMYGGDWPMTVPNGGYQSTWSLMRGCVRELSGDEQAEVLGRTAERVYGLPQTAALRDSGDIGSLPGRP